MSTPLSSTYQLARSHFKKIIGPSPAIKSKIGKMRTKKNSGGKMGPKKKKGGVPIKTLKKYYPILDKISKLRSKKKVSSIIESLPKSGIDSVCECLYNALYAKNIGKKSLHRMKSLPQGTKDNIRYLALTPRSKETKKRKEILKQSGGDISDIIAAVLPFLIPLLFGL